MTDAIVTTSQSLYEDAQTGSQVLISAQVPPSAPSIAQVQNATNLLIGDRTIRSRMDHFPGDLYDLRDESHLVRFVSALIGDSGAGQLRKRYLLARIQSMLDSANFYDLDGFYGAIFGSGRRPSEELPLDPYVDVETPDEWDQIMAIDARYRERIVALAAAIPMAATLPGIRQASEAILGVDCEVYEVWRFIDAGTNTVAPLPLWSDIETAYTTWADIEGIFWPSDYAVGGLGVTTPAEVIVRPKKTYDLTTVEGARERGMDELALGRVLSVLRPANVVISIDEDGVELHRTQSIASVEADSEYWEIVTKVTPSPVITRVPGLYPLSPSQIRDGVEWGEPRTTPKPPLVTTQGMQWEQASAVISVSAAAVSFPEGDDITQPGVGDGVVDDPLNYQRLVYFDGTSTAFSAERGVADPKTVQGGLTSAGGVLTASPFAASRTTVTPR